MQITAKVCRFSFETKTEKTHVVIFGDSMSSSVHNAQSALKVTSSVFLGGSAEINLKEENKIISHEKMELNAAAIDAILINGRQARDDFAKIFYFENKV